LVQRYVKGTCSLKHICEPFQLDGWFWSPDWISM
jgi:hypothetical protein